MATLDVLWDSGFGVTWLGEQGTSLVTMNSVVGAKLMYVCSLIYLRFRE